MYVLHVHSKVCKAPFHVWSKVCKFTLHIDGSNADFAPHREGSHADFAPYMEQRHSFRDKKMLNCSFSQFSKIFFVTTYIIEVYMNHVTTFEREKKYFEGEYH